MRKLSLARQRTEALQDRAVRFSTNVNKSCPPGRLDKPSDVVWSQLVRAADGTSNNLVEADNGSSDADFLSRMRIALREAKESRTCLRKIRIGELANAARVAELGLEQEADELAAIYFTIIANMERRLALDSNDRAAGRRRR
jgi:four helix bundle protein